MKTKSATVELSSFVGISFGATHTYAKLCYYDDDSEYTRIELEHPISTSEARVLNKIERESGYGPPYFLRKAGDLYYGFSSEDDACAFAVKYVNEHFPDISLIFVDESSAACFKKVLWAKDEGLQAKLNALWMLNETLYTNVNSHFRNISKKNSAKSDKLLKMYLKLLEEAGY